MQSSTSLIASSIIHTTTTSVNFVIVDDMQLTPTAGKYLISFSASGESDRFDANCIVAIFLGNAEIAGTTRHLYGDGAGHSPNFKMCFHSQALIDVNSNQAISVRWKTDRGIFKLHQRNLIALKV